MGGLGNDTYGVTELGDVVVENDFSGTDQVNSTLSYTLGAQAENLVLVNTRAGLALNGTGNALNSSIDGNNSSNTLSGLAGADRLEGGAGNDTLIGGAGRDVILGGFGNDRLHIDGGGLFGGGDLAAGEIYNGGLADDTLEGNAAARVSLARVALVDLENIVGFRPGLILTAAQLDAFTGLIDTGDITLAGGGGANIADAEVLTVTFNLSPAGNSLTLSDNGPAVHRVNGGAGNDTVTILGGTIGQIGVDLFGQGGNDNLTGGLGDDRLLGAIGADALTGGGGADDLDGDQGRDAVRGGLGNDLLLVDDGDILAGEIYDGGGGDDTLDGLDRVATHIRFVGTTLANLENVIGFGAGLTLTASQLDAFTKIISTGAITLAGAGAANITGATVQTNTFNLSAAGNDLALNEGPLVGYRVNGAGGNDTVNMFGSASVLGFFGAGGNDSATGGGANNELFGDAGSDTLIGRGGNDRLDGGEDRDDVQGGTGDDTILLDDDGAGDLVAGESYDGGAGGDTLEGASFFQGVDFSDVSLANIENLRGFSEGVVKLTAAQLDGINGDILTGDIELTTGGAADISDARVSTSNFFLSDDGNSFTMNDDGIVGNNGFSVLGGDGNDRITIVGGFFNRNDIRGFGGNDTLTGGDTSDELEGGSGVDVVSGGGGNDSLIVVGGNSSAGEVYDGGDGGDDALIGELDTFVATDLSNSTLANLENIIGFGGGLTLTAAQLDGLVPTGVTGFANEINTGDITLSTGGSVNLLGTIVITNTFNLSAAGNDLTLITNGALGYTVNGAAGSDTVKVVEGGRVPGGTILNGGGGSDVLVGGAGREFLNGGAGGDMLTGNAGSDSFIFDASAIGSTDTVTDFSGSNGEGDLLRIVGFGQGSYIGGADFTGQGACQARTVGAEVQVDTDGDANIDFKFVVAGGATGLTVFDFAIG